MVQPTISGTGTTPWVNGVYQDSLTCWAWGNPGYCGPNAIVRPGNNINFSFGQTDLYQTQAVANILPNSGTGLRVNGYNFGFTAKNGNGWDDGRVDYLSAYVHFTDKSGNIVEYDSYNLTYKYDWSNFNFSKNFTSPYSASTLGNVTYGFVGQDWNGWAGPYGPEIYNVSFSLKYSVDPCYVSVLSSPSCPGYLEALAKLNPPTTETTTPTTNVTQTGIQIVEPTTSTVVSTPGTQTTSASTTTEPTTTATTAATATSALATASVSTTATSAPSTTPTPTANNPQPKVGEVAASSSPKSTVSTSQILSIIANEQSRISSVEKSAVETTTQQATQASSSATQQAEAVAGQAQAQSIAASVQAAQAADQTAAASANAGTGITINAPSAVQATLPGNRNQQNGTGIVLRLPESFSPLQEQTTVTTNIHTNPISNVADTIASVDRTMNLENTQNVTAIDRQMLERLERQNVPTETRTTQPTGPSVNQKAKDNTAAGGVTIASINKQPQGFELYMTAMQDSKFYAPKEIYRGQRNVDNQRLLRGLTGGSDRLHQQMIEQQYQLGQ